MIRHVFIFLGMFVVGATIALVGRAAKYKSVAELSGPIPPASEITPMVSNVRASQPGNAAAPPAKPIPAEPAPSGREGRGTMPPAAADTAPTTTGAVNTVCAICGMDVDPKIPTIEYQGKKIGFGCTTCPPKFRADPDKYGPIYLRNEVIKR